jgi:hypothetical protein
VLKCRDHWSLAIIAYPFGASPSKGVRRTPALLPLDSMEGGHENVESTLRRWVFKELELKYTQSSAPFRAHSCSCESVVSFYCYSLRHSACFGESIWLYHWYQKASPRAVTSAGSYERKMIARIKLLSSINGCNVLGRQHFDL